MVFFFRNISELTAQIPMVQELTRKASTVIQVKRIVNVYEKSSWIG